MIFVAAMSGYFQYVYLCDISLDITKFAPSESFTVNVFFRYGSNGKSVSLGIQFEFCCRMREKE